MIIKYVKSSCGGDCDLQISSEDYRKIKTDAGIDDHYAMVKAVKAYSCFYGCAGSVSSRDIEEAYRHIKGKGTIIITAKRNDVMTWCEVYAVSEGNLIPVITLGSDGNKRINYSSKTLRELKKIHEEKHE